MIDLECYQSFIIKQNPKAPKNSKIFKYFNVLCC